MLDGHKPVSSPARADHGQLKHAANIAENVKQDLSIAIAAEKVFGPAASDIDLMKCFEIGCAPQAFDLIRSALLHLQVMALMRLWDTGPKASSISQLIQLLKKSAFVELIVQHERVAALDITTFETVLGPGERKTAAQNVNRDTECRESDVRANISICLKEFSKIQNSEELERLKKYRNEIIAHKTSVENIYKNHIVYPTYDDGNMLFEQTVSLVSQIYPIITGVLHDFRSNLLVWDRNQKDLWNIMRSAAHGEQFEPVALSAAELFESIGPGGTITIMG